ncbi:cytochrome c oxidase assembly protein COX18, mitochondrial-like [Amphibalanus amphitrite]|uniref:cytochrome c oxidase assembly protein COX18, mitochondrial-like n=1 Tax=Amphibalanus amphitrite TaxID=1232801 RepID=UPI001C8FD276|nr:cytochrome c oxidase assembly protein COX18, mitochondrial-like [Amphibalanus amphitrite]XP_043228729.1 cytochrome c oxidase assembly protein COX18, mitochondrial-like [Amphibalanus amphitrite]XP_043228738.1 cytochrome c oxidase assembly protein COX18, mitochondrial-like [Amphibalanus amphitrite]XP_043228747.1 cytochrome c oxidase assembly protein COX18, mitochondrial-like [Amphibalanus amphitrite]XP_043228755.1 cytochrome c oxidase assembly protein COX18, mitochondrial-like [Amphibalanus am
MALRCLLLRPSCHLSAAARVAAVGAGGDRPVARHFSVSARRDGVAEVLQSVASSRPVLAVQEGIVSLHDVSGLPWWATVLVTTVAARGLVTLPLGLYQSYILAKFENLRPEMDAVVVEIKKEMSVAVRKYQWDQKRAKRVFNKAVKKQMSELIAQHNCHPLKAGLVLWFQFPFWIGLSMALRNLSWALPARDAAAQLVRLQLAVGGVLWFPNLAMPDPTLALPVLFAVCNLCAIEVGVLSRVQRGTRLQRWMTNLARGVTVIVVPVAAQLPSAVVFYWTISSFCGLLSNLALMSPSLRRAAGVPLSPSQQQHPYRQLYENTLRRIGRR